jgi:hypothetical protein
MPFSLRRCTVSAMSKTVQRMLCEAHAIVSKQKSTKAKELTKDIEDHFERNDLDIATVSEEFKQNDEMWITRARRRESIFNDYIHHNLSLQDLSVKHSLSVSRVRDLVHEQRRRNWTFALRKGLPQVKSASYDVEGHDRIILRRINGQDPYMVLDKREQVSKPMTLRDASRLADRLILQGRDLTAAEIFDPSEYLTDGDQ